MACRSTMRKRSSSAAPCLSISPRGNDAAAFLRCTWTSCCPSNQSASSSSVAAASPCLHNPPIPSKLARVAPKRRAGYVLRTERTPVGLVGAALALSFYQLRCSRHLPTRSAPLNGRTEAPGSLRRRRSTCPGWGGRARRRASLRL